MGFLDEFFGKRNPPQPSSNNPPTFEATLLFIDKLELSGHVVVITKVLEGTVAVGATADVSGVPITIKRMEKQRVVLTTASAGESLAIGLGQVQLPSFEQGMQVKFKNPSSL
jgi:selenocysteine-specific translation elongation factor